MQSEKIFFFCQILTPNLSVFILQNNHYIFKVLRACLNPCCWRRWVCQSPCIRRWAWVNDKNSPSCTAPRRGPSPQYNIMCHLAVRNAAGGSQVAAHSAPAGAALPMPWPGTFSACCSNQPLKFRETIEKDAPK